MMSRQVKIKLTAITALTAFLSVIIFGLIFMMDLNMSMDQRMANGCPLSIILDGKICPESALGIAVHHFSIYQSLTNVPVNFGIAALIISLLFVLSAILAVFINLSFFGNPAFVRIFYNSPPHTWYKRKISRWLSLHENSPAFS